MMAVSVPVPLGSLALGTEVPYAWGAVPPLLGVVNRREPTEYRGDVLLHQGRHAAPELAMQFDAGHHSSFPRGALLGVVRLTTCLPPGDMTEDGSESGYWHWVIRMPRPFRRPVSWRGAPGLFAVHDSAIDALAVDAEETFRARERAAYQALAMEEKDEFGERLAVNELEYGMDRDLALHEALRYWQRSQALRKCAGKEGTKRPYGSQKRAVKEGSKPAWPVWK